MSENVEKMNEYRDLSEATRNARDVALEADDMVDTIRWIAAGGMGAVSLDELRRHAEALEATGEHIQECIDDVPHPREVRDGDADE